MLAREAALVRGTRGGEAPCMEEVRLLMRCGSAPPLIRPAHQLLNAVKLLEYKVLNP